MESELSTVEMQADRNDGESLPRWLIISVFVLCGCIVLFMMWYVAVLRIRAPKKSKREQ